eukprot:CAMPEP_0119070778 /NCGR_PEP_ID=MMETSP1178-20130426/42938_1 /TAXON_ID=33656 /ORGANISM="unid sp, Strain CCMP2000" /LENGTH=124 /DNA_ID=CAMNT_0007052651 /DNA_START=184 /DNA_END=559 /DNA_ORIENTATION=-
MREGLQDNLLSRPPAMTSAGGPPSALRSSRPDDPLGARFLELLSDGLQQAHVEGHAVAHLLLPQCVHSLLVLRPHQAAEQAALLQVHSLQFVVQAPDKPALFVQHLAQKQPALLGEHIQLVAHS